VLIELIIALFVIIGILVLTSFLVLYLNGKSIPPPYHFVESQGIKLHYFEKGTGPPLVFIHGSNGSLQDFKLSIMDGLSKDFRTVAFDRPGHGHSEMTTKGDGRPSHGDLVIEGWKKLGIERPILVGHSSAGVVLMDIAVKRPDEVAAIVLISGVVHSSGMEQVPVMGIYHTISKKYIGSLLLYTLIIPLGGLIGRWLLKFTFSPDPVPEVYRKIGIALALSPKSLRAESEDLANVVPTLTAVEAGYPKIRVPLIIVYGEMDHNVPPEGQSIRLSKEVPSSVIITIPNTGHMPMFTKTQEVVEAIIQAWHLSNDNRSES
jgi:pimeloyl-ACP methyl ester carboxylesterase